MPTISVARRAAPRTIDHTRAQFSARWLWPGTTVISVNGELDASNATKLTDCGIRHSGPNGQLVLDLSAVEFFGACCFACLRTLNVKCAEANVDWVLIPSTAVSQLLRICDPASALPVVTGLQAALSRLRDHAVTSPVREPRSLTGC
ncbi:anti-anti-sigma factor [Mycobacterium frederiksbergense]|uniref:Anti-anti-sigma factor n=1 Tax=Mycolicibacterium frederiksbergense TaxID=117567 RepID=A0ABT6L1K5_9MYCO|nr:STAS domain-containing protein [Mycolicibacterium frederiksbergense]MDH6196830.1 anti-anti-sigma factor [Mycolicibacterium frederiksbergense]